MLTRAAGRAGMRRHVARTASRGLATSFVERVVRFNLGTCWAARQVPAPVPRSAPWPRAAPRWANLPHPWLTLPPRRAQHLNTGRELRVEWEDGTSSRYNATWLQHNAPEHTQGDNGQKLAAAFEHMGDELVSAAISDDGHAVLTSWRDKRTPLRFPLAWLRLNDPSGQFAEAVRGGGAAGARASRAPVLWRHAKFAALLTPPRASAAAARLRGRRVGAVAAPGRPTDHRFRRGWVACLARDRRPAFRTHSRPPLTRPLPLPLAQ